MLTITVPGLEYFDEDKEEFVTVGEVVLELEHSLVALSKWESKFEKPFLGKDEKTTEEALWYVYYMIVTPGIAFDVLLQLSDANMQDVDDYINAKMTATWFSEATPTPKSSETITSELIYYWMNIFNIPAEYSTWHLNRLFTLIKIHNLKNAQPKKMNRRELAQRQRELNARRKAQLGTSG